MNYDLLKEKIEASGLQKKFIAKKMKVSYATLWHRLNGTRQFTPDELYRLLKIIDLKFEELF